MKTSAKPAFVIHCFEPFRRKCLRSGESTARVRAPSASEPEEDSESAYAATHSPETSFGRYRCFCASVPK